MSAALKIEDAIRWTPVRSLKNEPAKLEILYAPQEYLRREAEAETRHEYVAGRIYAMAGGSATHSLLAADIGYSLAGHLRGTECNPLTSDTKVRVADAGPFFYPDALVVCGKPHWDEDDCLRNPIAIVEVLSPSTESFDRGDKFVYYQRIASLRHYILIAQEKVYVEHRAKQENGTWLLAAMLTDPDDLLTISDIGVAVPVREIYRRVLPETDPATAGQP